MTATRPAVPEQSKTAQAGRCGFAVSSEFQDSAESFADGNLPEVSRGTIIPLLYIYYIVCSNNLLSRLLDVINPNRIQIALSDFQNLSAYFLLRK